MKCLESAAAQNEVELLNELQKRILQYFEFSRRTIAPKLRNVKTHRGPRVDGVRKRREGVRTMQDESGKSLHVKKGLLPDIEALGIENINPESFDDFINRTLVRNL